MQRVCPRCRATYAAHFLCPSCGVQTHEAGAPGPQTRVALPHEPESASFWARLLVGLLLAQGLYYGLRQLCTAYVLATVAKADQPVWWDSFRGLLAMQALQCAALLFGGVFAGAGQPRGLAAGAVLGVWNAVLILAVQLVVQLPTNNLVLYGQPILHAFVGAVGGAIGMSVWRPLPEISALAAARTTSPVLTTALPVGLAAPRDERIHWGRVLTGLCLASGGTIWASVIRDFVLRASGAGDKLQSQFVTWEITTLAMFVGGGMAGANTRRGLAQGFWVGGVSAVLLCAFQIFAEGGQKLPIQEMLGALFGLPGGEGNPATVFLVAAQSLLLCTAGGWLGAQLLPPTVRSSYRLDAQA